MAIIKFKVTASFPSEDILKYAKLNGYVENSNQTATEFVSDFFKKEIVSMIGKETIREIAQEKENEKIVEIESVKTRLAQAVSVEEEL